MKMTKADFIKLKDEINEWCLSSASYLMDEQTAKDIGAFNPYKYHVGRINKCKDIFEIRQYFLSVIAGRTYYSVFEDVVEREFPQYFHMLEKMLVLK